ncbi:MAG: cytochrome c peroxidase [Bacteroidales bacterium]
MKMNKKFVIGLILCITIVGVIAYKASNSAPNAQLSQNAQILDIFEKGGCISCHSHNPELPFYSKLPIIGSQVKYDAEMGNKYFNMEQMLQALTDSTPINKSDLAKIEFVSLNETMPPAKYYLIHWGSSITNAKRSILLDWIKNQRATLYPTTLAAAEFANEPIQPIDDALEVDLRKVVLGKLLYHDNRLSGNNSVSCASCHPLDKGGMDNLRYSEGISGQFGGVNAPTVFNSVYNFVQFWDGRANDLAEQAAGPPLNPIEMGSIDFSQIISKLQKDKKLVAAFKVIYPQGITENTITNAIAEFEKTLITPNSNFDKYLKGNKSALSADAIAGYEIFKAKGCATCHVGKNLGGQSFEPFGLLNHYFKDRGTEITEEDGGRFKETKHDYDMHRFKVPGLRNIALTAPYFHDGTIPSLVDAVIAMGKYQKGELTANEIESIVAFLNSLTGEYEGKKLGS